MRSRIGNEHNEKHHKIHNCLFHYQIRYCNISQIPDGIDLMEIQSLI